MSVAQDPFNAIVYSSPDQGLVHLLLEDVVVKVLICDVSASVMLTQTYTNTSETSTSRAKYVFPIPSRAAVCAFEMEHADGRAIVGVSKEKLKAAEEHETAIREGKFTGLLEWVTDDVFTISVGSIAAMQSVTTRLVYVLDLMDDEIADQVRFQLPVAIGKRYGTPPSGIENAASATTRTRIRIAVDIQMSGRIRDVSSPTHTIGPPIPYKTHLGKRSRRRTTVKFRSGTFLQHNFVLAIQADGLDAPRCFAEPDLRGAGTIAMQLTMVPKFKLPPIPAQEFIFVVDRSGSMSGARIETAKQTLKLLLHMLPSDHTMFNIVSFGYHADGLWPNSQNYTQDTLDYGTRHVESMSADYGGTEIRSALAFALRARNFHQPTVVFVLTDGESTDIDGTTATVTDAVSASTDDAPLRVFTLGIGDTVSTAMCDAIARAGHGLYLLAVSSESIVGKCARLLRAGRSSILKDVSIDWGVPPENTTNGTARFVPPQDLSNGGSSTVQISPAPAVQQTPHHIYNIDPGMRFIVFMITTHKDVPKDITLRGKLDGTTTPVTWTVPVEYVKPFPSRDETPSIPLVHTLAARRLITDFEDNRAPLPTASAHASIEDIRKAVIVRLGEEYQLASKHTSFVAVEDTTQNIPSRGIRDSWGRSLGRRVRRPINQNDEGGQGSSLENIIGGALTLLTYAMSYFQGTNSRGRSSRNVPGAFPASRPSLSPVGGRGRSTDSFSTLSSLNGSLSAWSTSRTSSPSPPQSENTEHERSPSPVLQDLHQASAAVQGQHVFDQGSTRPPDAGGPVPPQIFDLVQLQSFDGSFPLNDSLGQIVGHDAIGRAAEFQVDDKKWATALAVAFFKKHLSKQPDLLQGLLDKAMEFVRDDVNFDSLIVRAKALVI